MRTRSIASSANASHLENDPRRPRKVSPAEFDITKQSGDVSNVSFMYSSVFLRVEGRANADRVDCNIDAVKNCGRDVENSPNSIENEMLLHNKGAIGRSAANQSDCMTPCHQLLLLEPLFEPGTVGRWFFISGSLPTITLMTSSNSLEAYPGSPAKSPASRRNSRNNSSTGVLIPRGHSH